MLGSIINLDPTFRLSSVLLAMAAAAVAVSVLAVVVVKCFNVGFLFFGL